MTGSLVLSGSLHCLPQATTTRVTTCKLCNAHRCLPQRQLISLRNFTAQLPSRRSQLRRLTHAAMHGDDWSTAPASYLTLVRVFASPRLSLCKGSALILFVASGTGTLLREDRRRKAHRQVCDRTYHCKLTRVYGSRYVFSCMHAPFSAIQLLNFSQHMYRRKDLLQACDQS